MVSVCLFYYLVPKVHAARDRIERQRSSFAMLVSRRCCVVPMAMFRPAMARSAMMSPAMTSPPMSPPAVPVRVVATMAVVQLLIGSSGHNLAIGAINRPLVLTAGGIATIPRDTMAARHRAE